jgi:hypothetical protein
MKTSTITDGQSTHCGVCNEIMCDCPASEDINLATIEAMLSADDLAQIDAVLAASPID